LLPAQAEAAALQGAHAPLVRCDSWFVGAPGSDGLASDAAHGELLRFAVDPDTMPALPDTGFELTDVAAMCSTSGTTGMPKIVVYDHACYWLNGLDTIDLLDIGPDDRALEYRTFDWYSAQILSLMPFLQTGSTLCVARRFSRSRFADWIARYQVTV